MRWTSRLLVLESQGLTRLDSPSVFSPCFSLCVGSFLSHCSCFLPNDRQAGHQQISSYISLLLIALPQFQNNSWGRTLIHPLGSGACKSHLRPREARLCNNKKSRTAVQMGTHFWKKKAFGQKSLKGSPLYRASATSENQSQQTAESANNRAASPWLPGLNCPGNQGSDRSGVFSTSQRKVEERKIECGSLQKNHTSQLLINPQQTGLCGIWQLALFKEKLRIPSFVYAGKEERAGDNSQGPSSMLSASYGSCQ